MFDEFYEKPAYSCFKNDIFSNSNIILLYQDMTK